MDFFSSNFPFGINTSLRFFTQARLEMIWADKVRHLYTRRARLHINSANCLRCCLLDLPSVGDDVVPLQNLCVLNFSPSRFLLGLAYP